MILDWHQENEKDVEFLNITHLHQLQLTGDDVATFIWKWDEIMLRLKNRPNDDDLLHICSCADNEIKGLAN